tara:strand:- start:2 stop:262 length:261 start_codon:yes stop_codon:yes gene_type:complete
MKTILSIKKKKIIFLSTIIGSILFVVSFFSGAYTFYHKIFPFGATKKIVEKVTYVNTAYHDIEKKNYNLPNYSNKKKLIKSILFNY